MSKLSQKHLDRSTRSLNQNAAMHVLFKLYADTLNDGGLYMQKVLKPSVDINWTKDTFKEYVWRPVMEAQTQKKSTTQLTTTEVQEVYDTLNRYFGEKYHLTIDFPSYKQLINYEETP